MLAVLALALSGCIRDLDDEGVFTQGTVEGRALEQQSQQPVGGLHVALYALTDTLNALAQGGTDNEGRFSLPITAEQQSKGCLVRLFADSLYAPASVGVPTGGLGRGVCDLGVVYVLGPAAPTLGAMHVGQPSATDVHCSASVTDAGRSGVTARGFVYSTMQYPTLADGSVSVGGTLGDYAADIADLHPGTVYYVRAFATNGVGTAYGEQQSVLTLSGLPEVQTDAAVADISVTAARCGGVVVADGGFAVTARGVCWSMSPEPTVQNLHTSDGSGLGTFVSNLTGLVPATTYYLRAYATNANGTAYGQQRTFTTPSGLPQVQTAAITDVSATSAHCGGTVVGDGGFDVTARGVCYSTSPEPTVAAPHTTDGTGTGAFVSHLSALAPATTYYLRAYATNALGTTYGQQLQFTTPE